MSRGNRGASLAVLNREVRGWQADQELFDAVAAELAGLNRTDWRCLDLLGTRGSMTAGQLAEAAHLTTGAVTGVLDHLEAAGLVRRVRDTVDRRRVIVQVTDEVERRAAPAYGPLVKDSAEVMSVFDADQLEVITDFVRRERGLLTRHTARLHEMLAARTDTSANPRPRRTSACPASTGWQPPDA
jgi:DNA-binding MarR family transcriptional regulator